MTQVQRQQVDLNTLFNGVDTLAPVKSLQITAIESDSRKVSDGALFLAVPGETVNGEEYIDKAVANGAVAVCVDGRSYEKYERTLRAKDIACVAVPNIKKQAGVIAANFYQKPSQQTQFVGVTGTNGKSTVVSLISQLYSGQGKKAATIGTMGYGFEEQKKISTGMTTPDALQCQKIARELVDQSADVISMEVSSHGVAQNRIAGLDFQTVALLNITRDHLDYHNGFGEYANVKKSFIRDNTNARIILNADSKECDSLANEMKAITNNVVTFSRKHQQADVYAENISCSLNGIEADIHTPWGQGKIKTPIVGDFNLENLLAAISVCSTNERELKASLEVAKTLRSVEGRMQRVTPPENDDSLPNVFIDFAHTPDALEKTLAVLNAYTQGQLWVVFGCGGDRDKGKRSEMGRVAEKLADRIVVTNDNPRTEDSQTILAGIVKGITHTSKVETMPDRAEAIAFAVQQASSEDCVLIAGKGHEDYQILGDKKIFFSDALEAENALEKRGSSSGGEQ